MSTIAYFGHHKCASTYIAEVTRQVARLLGLTTHTEYLSTRLPLGYEKLPEQASRIANAYHALTFKPYDCLCHGNADQAAAAAVTQHGPFRGFHVIRDPRDLIVSGYFWHQSSRSLKGEVVDGWNAERCKRLRLAPTTEAGLLLEIEFAASHFATMGEWDYQQSNVYEMKYEDMIVDPVAFFTNALAFVGLPVVDSMGAAMWGIRLNQIALKLIKRPTVKVKMLPRPILLQILNNLAFVRQAGGRRQGEGAPAHKYRKGIAGDWRNHFTPRVADAFHERYGTLLLQLGYE